MQENMFRDWFKNRHVSDSVLTDFGIHWGESPIMGACIVIPVHDEQGIFLYNKYRRNPLQNLTPKYMYDKGGHIALYAWHKAKKSEYTSLLITEGEFDTLVAWSENIPAITSTGGANSFQEHWADLLKDKDITICFDNDSAGALGMVRVLKYIPHAYVVFLPDRPGIKDITDYVSNGGNLTELLRTRIHFDSLQDVIDHRAKRLALYQSTWFHDAYEEAHTVPEYVQPIRNKSIKNDAFSKAKIYPIENLLKFNYQGSALCIWHNEKSGSLHYYKESNTVYCFGCGKHGDAIDVYRQLHNCSFKEAVDFLSKN